MTVESSDPLAGARRFGTRGELAERLATDVAEYLRASVDARGAASLVVSGGSTPVPFFQRIRTATLPWSDISITLADERWVDEDDPLSNAALVREHLLQDAAAAATFVPLKTPATDPFTGAGQAAVAVAAMPRPFDVVILGMGGDGHTASLFPQSDQLEIALDRRRPELCLGVHGEKPPRQRITLTLRALLDSRRLVLHLTGDEKWETLERASRGGPLRDYPIRSILHQAEVPVDVYWAA